MMDWSWITTTSTAALMVVLSTLGIYITLMVLTRLGGLRSFSKMSSFDFAITVAMGSLIATVILSENPPLLQGIVGLAALFGIQITVAVLRSRTQAAAEVIDNDPLLLMAGSEVLHENLRKARITEDDLTAKLREANVIDYTQIRAVVMESTGDVAVLHADPDGPDLAPGLLSDVRDAERLLDKQNVRDAGET
jgi:uncharacterized membrane protein YcaP (DUF421 family)